MVNIPKTRKTYCRGSDCKKHTLHKVTQYSTCHTFARASRALLLVVVPSLVINHDNTAQNGERDRIGLENRNYT